MRWLGVVVTGVLASSALVCGAAAQDWQEVDGQYVGEGVVGATDLADVAAAASGLSAAEHEALYTRLLRKRERRAARVHNAPASAGGLPEERVPETTSGDGVLTAVESPEDLIIGRNSKNTQAQGPGGSTLAEPAAANHGPLVFAAGNFNHAEYSTDGGARWTDVPLPAGRPRAPFLCCDHDVVIDDARRTVFHSTLYVSNDLRNGVVRIFVRRPIDASGEQCFYDIDPGGGAILPDYPHIGLTKRHLYLTINALVLGGGVGLARIYRFDLDAMDNCRRSVDFEVFDQDFSEFGQRVWVPAEGTNNFTTMFWAQHNNDTVMRLFRWREESALPEVADALVTQTNFTNPDCRGGIGNYDWIERVTAWSIAGFTHRCALAAPTDATTGPLLACYWNAGPTGAATQGHVRSAIFDLVFPTLFAQPHIFNNQECFGYPVVTANKRGDLGISIASGGRAGGGGDAVGAGVGIDDEFTPGIGNFDPIVTTVQGIANRSDSRFGDYFTIHPYEPCEKWFAATNYAWSGAPVDSADDVNSRYVEFGREQSRGCYEAYRDQIPSQR